MQKKDAKLILGIDPGYGRIGFAVIEANGAGTSWSKPSWEERSDKMAETTQAEDE